MIRIILNKNFIETCPVDLVKKTYNENLIKNQKFKYSNLYYLLKIVKELSNKGFKKEKEKKKINQSKTYQPPYHSSLVFSIAF